MGCSASLVTPSLQQLTVPQNFNYFSLIFNDYRFSLLAAPGDVVQATHTLLAQIWEIENVVRPSTILTEFYLKNIPNTVFFDKTLEMQEFMCRLLQMLYTHGWKTLSAVKSAVGHFKQGQGDKDVLIFTRCQPRKVNVISINHDKGNLRVLGPPEIFPYVEQIVRESWRGAGIIPKRQSDKILVIHLSGYTFHSWEKLVPVMNQLFRRMPEAGWQYKFAIRSCTERPDALYFVSCPPGNYSNFCAVTLSQACGVTFVEPPPELLGQIGGFMRQSWPHGIQTENIVLPLVAYALKDGKPWCHNYFDMSKSTEAIEKGRQALMGRKFICELLQFMSLNNYSLHSTWELDGSANTTSTFFFYSKPPPYLPKQPTGFASNFLCVAPTAYNLIRLINGSQHTALILRQAIASGWPLGIEKEGTYAKSHEFKLNGQPFFYCVENHVCTALMLMLIISAFQANGYRCLTSCGLFWHYCYYFDIDVKDSDGDGCWVDYLSRIGPYSLFFEAGGN